MTSGLSIFRTISMPLLGVVLLACAGCSDERVRKADPSAAPAQSGAEPEYSFKVLVERGGTKQIVHVMPNEVAAAVEDGSESPGSSTQSAPLGPGLRPLATVEGDDGESIDTQREDATKGRVPGTTLLMWAAKSCLLEAGGTRYVAEPWGFYTWAAKGHFVIQAPIQYCDDALFYQQMLLCAASRLNQAADSVGTVTWNANDGPNGDADDVMVTIPPQATENRFIARDMAITALAHIADLQLLPPSYWNAATPSCIDGYTEMAAGTASASLMAALVPSPPQYFEPLDPDPNTSGDEPTPQEIGRARLRQQAATAIAAQDLLRQTVERSLAEAKAGAERQKGNAGDPRDGIRRFWGAPGAVKSPYNTMRHALRLLFGRLELPRSVNNGFSEEWQPLGNNAGDWHSGLGRDPRCTRNTDGTLQIFTNNGYEALQVMDALDMSFNARWNDVPPRTPAQALAISTFERAGIILPDYTETATWPPDAAAVRAAVKAQLVRDAAEEAFGDRAGSEFPAFLSDFRTHKQAKAIEKTIDRLSDEDIRFALDRVYDAFRLLTETGPAYPFTLNSSAFLAGVPIKALGAPDLPGGTDPLVESLAGIVVAGGLPRHALAGDVIARLGYAQRASQCGHEATTAGPVNYTGGRIAAFQNVFSLADVLRRNLGVLRDRANQNALADIAELAELGVAAGRDFAGGRVTHYTRDGAFQLRLTQFSPEDLGVEDLADATPSLVMVDPSPMLAECVASIRTVCPANIAVHAPSDFSVSTSSGGGVTALGAGLNGPALGLEYASLPLTYEGFLVQRPHPNVSGTVGRVLAFVSRVVPDTDAGAADYEKISTEIVSPAQRRMAEAVFGLQPFDKAQRTCANIAPTSLPRDYCIDGLKRDMFVPLANELTSTGNTEDSWRHYIEVAEQAAGKADELGRQLIEVGLQKDLRQEAATEEVGELCGAYPNTLGVNSSDGRVQDSADDGSINECIDPEPIDLVFLRRDPYEGLDPQVAEERICEDFCEDDSPNANAQGTPCLDDDCRPRFCRKCADGDLPAKVISHDAFGFSSTLPEAGDPPTLEECQKLQQTYVPGSIATSPYLNKTDFAALTESPWVSRTALATTLSSTRLKQLPNGHWVVFFARKPRLGTLGALQQVLTTQEVQQFAPDVWPACQDAGLTCSEAATTLGSFFTAIPTGDPAQHPELLREVESALFYMGALAGRIPAGTFEIPLPVVNTGPAIVGTEPVVPALALYGAGRMLDLGQGQYQLQSGGFLPGTLQTGESALVSGAVPMDPGLPATRGLSEPLEAPNYVGVHLLWADAQNALQRYLSLDTANAAIEFDANFTAVLSAEQVANGTYGPALANPSGREALGTWLQQLAQRFAPACQFGPVGKTLLFAGTGRGVGIQSVSGERATCNNAFVPPVFSYIARSGDRFDNVVGATIAEHYSNRTGPASDYIGYGFALDELLGYTMPSDAEIQAECRQIICEEPDGFVPNCYLADCCHTDDCPGTLGASPNTLKDYYFGNRNPQCLAGLAPYVNAPNRWLENFWLDTAECAGNPEALWSSQQRLRPNQCPPSERVEVFLNKDLPDDCTAMTTVIRALGMSCMTDRLTRQFPPGAPPDITGVDDLVALEAWLGLASRAVGISLDAMYFMEVPEQVVKVGTGVDVNATVQGERGRLILEAGKNLREIESAFANIHAQLNNLEGEIRKVRIELEAASLEADRQQLALTLERLDLAFRKLEVERQTAVAALTRARDETALIMKTLEAGISGAVAGAAAGGVGAIFGLVGGVASTLVYDKLLGDEPEQANLEFLRQQRDVLNEQDPVLDETGAVVESIEQNRIDGALATLSQSSDIIYQAISDHLTQASDAQASALQSFNALLSNQSQAEVALARATGADFVALEDGLLPLPVNTVLRRQYGVLEHRYRSALASAKRAAYVARLAVEQRLGTRMNDLVEPIGPIDAPSLWVDDLCSVQGIDYNALRCAGTFDPETDECNYAGLGGETPNGDSAEFDLIKGFADQYIGDYVAKLKEFVEFYNVRYPFREADDTAIVSLREDLRNSDARCLRESKNLLSHSDRLDAFVPGFGTGGMAEGGWRVSGCAGDTCLVVAPGANLVNTVNNASEPLAPPNGFGGATWLRTVAAQTLQVDLGGSADPLGPLVEAGPRAAAAVYQTVELRAGQRYALSWWDVARSSGGDVYTGAAPPSYRASVSTKGWTLIATDEFEPEYSGIDWSPRRVLTFSAPSDGQYQIAFMPAGGAVVGLSLAIANVQLEASAGADFGPTAYEATGEKRLVFSGSCPIDDPEAFRKRFDYRCGRDGCYYELRDLFLIDTEVLSQGFSSLVGKVGIGNYNYRHTGSALNLVGTGVLDCSRDPRGGCNSSGYVEYDLTHHAFNVPITDYSNEVRCFNFGTGAVRSGKALATERLLSLPLGREDQDLIHQSAFLKPEFAGRPLSGSYRLRIKDQPALIWEHVDDVQLLMNYRYWSRVDRGPGN